MVSWELARDFFVWEGGFPEIVTCGPEGDIWRRVLAALPQSRWNFRYSWDGDLRKLPKDWGETDGWNGSPLLEIEPTHLQLNAHFHEDDTVAFTLDPRDFQNEAMFKELIDFMSWFADVTGTTVMLSPPGQQKFELFRIEPPKNI